MNMHRIAILRIGMVCLFILLAGRLLMLSVVQHEKWAAAAEALSVKTITVSAARGEIRDRYGRLLAGSTRSFSLRFDSADLSEEEIDRAEERLKQILTARGEEAPADFREAAEKLGYYRYMPVIVASGISEETAAEVTERSSELPGVSVTAEMIRCYPEGATAAHILGYLGKIPEADRKLYVTERGYDPEDRIGLTGVEAACEQTLRGQDGVLRVQVNAYGERVGVIGSRPPVKGTDVRLTIDLELQKTAEAALEQALEGIQEGGVFESVYGDYRFGKAYPHANTGAVVALDVETGEILAMASAPDYDPNLFADGISRQDWQTLQRVNPQDPLSPSPLYHVAAMSAVQPGSTFKPVTATAALEKGLDPDRRLYDGGVIRAGGRPFGCLIWHRTGGSHGYLDMRHALEVSCNYYFYDIVTGWDYYRSCGLGYTLTVEELLEYAEKYGLGSPTGIEIGETAAGLPALPEGQERWYLGDAFNLAIGQGQNQYTCLQMARFLATLGNGGVRSQVRLLLDGERTPPQETGISQETIDCIVEGMELAASGSAGSLRGIFGDFPARVAAKSGTAEKSGKIPPDYTESYDNFAWVMAMAPAEDPQIAVVVLIFQGGTAGNAAPAAREVIGKYLNL